MATADPKADIGAEAMRQHHEGLRKFMERERREGIKRDAIDAEWESVGRAMDIVNGDLEKGGSN